MLAVTLVPGLSWLWWADVGFALLTPVMAMAGQRFVSRKVRETETAQTALEEILRNLEGD